MKREILEAKLKEAGVELLVAETRAGETMSGYWQDGVYLGDTPELAAEVLWSGDEPPESEGEE